MLRADTFYMAHCGPVQAFLINPSETRPLHELSSAGRGLGLSRTTPVRYVQARLADGDFLLLASQPSAGWTESVLRHPQRQGIDGMRRQLVDYAVADVNSVLIHAQAGTGRLRFLHRKPGAPGMAQAATEVQELRDIEASSPPPPKPGWRALKAHRARFSLRLKALPARRLRTPRPAQPAAPAPGAGVRRAGMEQPLDSGPAAATPTADPRAAPRAPPAPGDKARSWMTCAP